MVVCIIYPSSFIVHPVLICLLCGLCGKPTRIMKNAVIVDCCRTPIGRAHAEKGVFRDVRSDDLAVAVVRALVERTGIDPTTIEDVVLGNTQQQREQGFNVARTVGLMAGLPVEAGGATVNRLCGSSLQALAQASHAILADAEDVQIVGGLEHMHHIPMDAGIDLNPKLFTRTSKGALMMGITAEFLAQTQGISREDQDRFALASHQKATAAYRDGEAGSPAGQFAHELIPVWGRDEACNRILVERDQCVRPDTSIEALAALQPAFMPGMTDNSPRLEGTINMSGPKIQRIDASTIAVIWMGWGRPNFWLEPGMQWIAKRTSKHIWHDAEVWLHCEEDGTGTYTIPSFDGSRFPSHRLWVNDGIPAVTRTQRFYSDLWTPSQIYGPQFVK